MNKLRCFLLAAVVIISSATFALGGDMQGPGKNDPLPTSALTIASTRNGLTQPASTGKIQIVLQDATTMFMEILLTIF